VDLGFSKVGLLTFYLSNFFEQSKNLHSVFLPHTHHPKQQQLLDVVFLLSTDSFTVL